MANLIETVPYNVIASGTTLHHTRETTYGYRANRVYTPTQYTMQLCM